MIARALVAIARWYVDTFGTVTCFALSLAILLFWLALIPLLGLSHWNAGPGLGGNTVESTGEWFFAVGTLIVAKGIDTRQQAQVAHIEQLERRHGAMLRLIAGAVGVDPAALEALGAA